MVVVSVPAVLAVKRRVPSQRVRPQSVASSFNKLSRYILHTTIACRLCGSRHVRNKTLTMRPAPTYKKLAIVFFAGAADVRTGMPIALDLNDCQTLSLAKNGAALSHVWSSGSG
jgi:hypothetical protein